MGGDQSYPVDDYWTPCSDVHYPCGMGSTSLVCAYTEGWHHRKGLRVPDCGEWSYPGDNGAGASSDGGGDDADGGGDDADGGESVGLARKLLLIM
jgi:hypothetical protein